MYPNLKLHMFKRGIHQNRLARQLGIADAVLSKIIHGYREPTKAERALMAEYLQVDEAWLFEKYESTEPAELAGAANRDAGPEGHKNGLG